MQKSLKQQAAQALICSFVTHSTCTCLQSGWCAGKGLHNSSYELWRRRWCNTILVTWIKSETILAKNVSTDGVDQAAVPIKLSSKAACHHRFLAIVIPSEFVSMATSTLHTNR